MPSASAHAPTTESVRTFDKLVALVVRHEIANRDRLLHLVELAQALGNTLCRLQVGNHDVEVFGQGQDVLAPGSPELRPPVQQHQRHAGAGPMRIPLASM